MQTSLLHLALAESRPSCHSAARLSYSRADERTLRVGGRDATKVSPAADPAVGEQVRQARHGEGVGGAMAGPWLGALERAEGMG